MSIELEPIGIVHTPFAEKALAPRQPSEARDARGVVTLFEGRGLEDALDGLSSFDTIWILFHFHKTEGRFRPKVQPPRSEKKRGVFATRSPYCLNAIGMSAVRRPCVMRARERLSPFARAVRRKSLPSTSSMALR